MKLYLIFYTATALLFFPYFLQSMEQPPITQQACSPALQAYFNYTCMLKKKTQEEPTIESQETPLFKALLQRAYTQSCNLIQQPEINVNEIDIHGVSLLMLCCAAGLNGIVQAMLKRPDILINAQDNNKYTALMHAVFNKKVTIITLLLAHPQIDIFLKDCNDKTALYWAEKRGNEQIIALIKEAEKNARWRCIIS